MPPIMCCMGDRRASKKRLKGDEDEEEEAHDLWWHIERWGEAVGQTCREMLDGLKPGSEKDGSRHHRSLRSTLRFLRFSRQTVAVR